MHVLITSDTVGGVWTYTQELVTGLITRGHRVTLVSFGRLPESNQTEWLRALPAIDYRPTEYALEWMETAQKDFDESRRYLELLVKEVKPDVLHLSQYCYGDLAAGVPKIVVAHSDIVSWWLAVHGREPEDSPWIRRYRQIVCHGLRGADLVVAPSQWMLDSLSRHYSHTTPGAVIYNGRTASQFDPDQDKENSVLSVGRLWDAGKHMSLLLEGELPVPVFLVGWEREPGRENASRKVEVPPNVQLLGPKSQAELRGLFAAAGIYVATSRYEPFGLAPLEAALSRCTLVLNDNPVFHELWDDVAIFFKRDDSEDLARVIATLSRDPLQMQEYGERAHHRAATKFSASSMVQDYERICQSICMTAGVA
jgi:glycogen(starch) synthase